MRDSRRIPRSLAVLALAAVVLSACGGAAAPTATTASPAATAAAATPTRSAAVQPTPTATPAVAASTPTPRVAASRGKIVYAKPVDLGRTNIYAVGGAGGPDNPFTSGMYAGLTAKDLEGKLVPYVASKWESSADGLLLDFTIRQGAFFQDGTPVTAADVAFSGERYLGQVPPPIRAVLPTKIEQIAPDKVRFTFPEPDPTFASQVLVIGSGGLGIIPKAYWESVGGTEGFSKAPIAAGPYRLAQRFPADKVIFEAHEKFFTGPPAVKTIDFRITPEDSTRTAMFRTSEADISESIAPQYLSDLEKLPGAKILTVRSGQEVVINILQFHEKIPGTDLPNPFRDIRVRKALSHAVDKKAIVERIAGRGGVAVKGPYSTYHSGADPDNITDYEYNPEKAKQLLREANFPFDMTVPVYAYIASAPAPQAVEAFTNYLQAVGIKAQYRLVEVSSLIRLWRAKEAWPMSFVRSWSVVEDPGSHYQSYMWSKGSSSFYNDPAMDQIFDEFRKARTDDKYLEGTKKLFHYIHDQALVVDLYAIVDNHGIGPKVDWRYPPGLPARLEWITWR